MKRHKVNICECGKQAWALMRSPHVVMVDVIDRNLLDEFWWSPKINGKTTYADSPRAKSRGRNRLLHRNIMPESDLIDHRDRNGLNNMRKNMRETDKAGNSANIPPRGKRKYKGVKTDSRKTIKNRFCARIAGKHLGRFATEEMAAARYDEEAKKVFGPDAWLNFPE